MASMMTAMAMPQRISATANPQDTSAEQGLPIRPIEKKSIKDFIENAWKEVRMLEIERLRKEAAQKAREQEKAMGSTQNLRPGLPEKSRRSPVDRSVHSQRASPRPDASRSVSEANLPPMHFSQTAGFDLESQVQERRLAASKINQTLTRIQERQKLKEDQLAEERSHISQTLKKFEHKSTRMCYR
jgi:hypothetical protein